MTRRHDSGKEFDPSSFDDVLELVSTWTRERSMTASEIVERLRARGVAVRATTSGRHVIIESPGRYPGQRSEAKLFVMPTTPPHVRQWVENARDSSFAPPRVIRPPGQALHWLASLFGKRTREHVLEPIIADMQVEYCEVLAAAGRPRRVRLWLVQLRAWIAFAEAIVLNTVLGRIISGLSRMQ